MSSNSQILEMSGRIPRANMVPTSISSNNITKVQEEGTTQIDKVVETMAETSVIIITKNTETNSQSSKIMASRTKPRKTNTIKSRTNTTMSTMQNKITMNPMTI